MRLLLATALLALSAPAHAQQLAPAPPAKYDHPFRGKLIVEWADRRDMARACEAAVRRHLPHVRVKSNPFAQVGACAVPIVKDRCVIVLPRDLPEFIASARRHEEGHCNGWPPHHPGARAGASK